MDEIGAQFVFTAVLDEGVGELEGRSRSRQQLEIRQFRIDLGVDDGQRVGQFGSRFVVVGDDDVDAHFPGPLHRVAAGDAAVHGDQHAAGAEGLQRLVQRLRREAVAVVEAVGDERIHHGSVAPEHPGQQGAGGDAVGVVVPVDEDRLVGGDGPPQPG